MTMWLLKELYFKDRKASKKRFGENVTLKYVMATYDMGTWKTVTTIWLMRIYCMC